MWYDCYCCCYVLCLIELPVFAHHLCICCVANKCVFCWRQSANPVTRGFDYVMDPPEMIIEEAIAKHVRMIKQIRGVPGVVPQRFAEALQPRHCALSLVGEPVIYPAINRFVELLHEKGISSFMVTNAQFPQQMRDLSPVTQLYVSVDAATPVELKAIDRPIFADYWERFIECLDILRTKKERTVFRLTLVRSTTTTLSSSPRVRLIVIVFLHCLIHRHVAGKRVEYERMRELCDACSSWAA